MNETPNPELAQQFAEIAHAGQRYNQDVPYTVHLKKVVEVLNRFGAASPEMVCAAWLHDSIEDTNTSYNDIKKRFGLGVAELVFAVTSELGRNRKERNEKTYPKIAGNMYATILKLADRIANVEYGMATGGKNDMYSKEFSDFENNLRYFEECDGAGYDEQCTWFLGYAPISKMWEYLEILLKPKK